MNKQRPQINCSIPENISDVEKIQNTILRPIIKMQHVLLIVSFENYLKKRKIDFSALSSEEQSAKIASIYKTDTVFKSMAIGYIVGHFSETEYALYLPEASEIHRRIIQIIIQRIQDSIISKYV